MKLLTPLLVCTAVFAASAAAQSPEFTAPVVTDADSEIVNGFGPGDDSEFHSGSDVRATAGEAVHAPGSGEVVNVHQPGELRGYRGQVVDIDHGEGVKTRYSNLVGVSLERGAGVEAGDLLGRVDGDHVHVELWRSSTLVDPATAIALTAPQPR